MSGANSEDIRAGINISKKLVTILLMFDFSRAFDTISPSKLLCKIINLGFSRSVVRWIMSYITGRNQRVMTKSNGGSDWLATNLGVPQGSVLGPLLFSLYINDLQETLAKFKNPEGDLAFGVEHLLYADDLQTYTQVSVSDVSRGVDRLSAVARAVSIWARNNDLRLNVGKTKAIILGSEYNINKLQCLNLPGIEVEDGVFVPFVDSVTNLGVVMDSKLTWKAHVDAISRKVNRVLYSLGTFRSCTTEALREQLANALVVPHLDYCSLVFLDLSGEQQTRLQRLQNSCVRYICGARKGEHISPYRRKLDWLTVEARREYFAVIQLYKAIVMGQPPYLAALFRKNQSRTSGRNPRELEIPSSRTETGLKSFSAQGARLWHTLPGSIKNMPSLKLFKNAIRKYIQQKYVGMPCEDD